MPAIRSCATPRRRSFARPSLKHQGIYYLFASNHQWTKETGVINRWTSTEGLHWGDKTTVLRPTEPWEGHFHNVGMTIDDDGTWRMLYTTDGPFGYAWSPDGLHWTKHQGPGDLGLLRRRSLPAKIGRRYYAWHSREHQGHLRIYCSQSADMVDWKMPGRPPADRLHAALGARASAAARSAGTGTSPTPNCWSMTARC